MIDLSIVIVSWNVQALLERCLLSLTKHQGQHALQCEIIVVDNASTDGSAEMVRRLFPMVRLIDSPDNLGFSRANNLGISRSVGRHLLLINPDAEVIGDSLATMVRYLDQAPDVGAVGPRILFPDGTVQPSRRRFPTLATAFLESTLLQHWLPRNRVLNRYYVQDRPDDQEQVVDWMIGACLCIRRSTWDQVGPLDEDLFMYSEELDWFRRLQAEGWRAVYLPSARVVHHEGQSSQQVIAERHIHFQSSKVHYFHKHHGAPAGEILRLFLLSTYVFLLSLESVKWLIGHRRPLRRSRFLAYLRVLRSGLRLPRTARE